MPNSIQPREYSKGSGTDGTLYITATRMATCTSATSTSMTTGGTGTIAGSTTTGTTTTLRRGSQLSSFLPSFWRGVLFRKLSVPSSKHFPNLINLYGNSHILLVIKRFCLPQNHQQYLECINFTNGKTHIRHLFFSHKKACTCDSFNAFYKKIIYPFAERIPMEFG